MNLVPTKTSNTLSQRLADFDTLIDALEYAALGEAGCNFYDARGKLRSVLPHKDLRDRARHSAQRLLGLGLKRGERVALVADTSAEFISFLHEAAEELEESLAWVGTPEQLDELPESAAELHICDSKEVAYLQFTSGSTRFPQGVVITEQAIMSNLRGIVQTGLEVRAGDRCASWLPFYHDMGLVGFVLGPIVSQLSVDYLRTRDFAVRPLQWLRLISNNNCTIAFSPPFGFELCSRRVHEADIKELALGHWRVAGVGAEMIRPSILENFAARLGPAGFNSKAFLPCYGLAEASLAASFSTLGKGLEVMRVDAMVMAEKGLALRVQDDNRKINHIVNCGSSLPGHSIAIVDEEGGAQPDLRVGHVLIKGPSLMSGYLNDTEATKAVLTKEGWLDTGDLGYMFEGELHLTGRAKDIIIVNGRNIRAQDLEELAEDQAEIRMGDVSAFGLDSTYQPQSVVLVVECRTHDTAKRQSLIARLQRLVYEGFGVRCLVELVPAHTLPRTSSGKLSRVAARQGFLERLDCKQASSANSKLA